MQSPSLLSSVALSGIVARLCSSDVGKGAIWFDVVGFGAGCVLFLDS
jgi:hypothetical protein